MSCPRPGKECNEFMCGYSVEGVWREEIGRASCRERV